MEPGVWVVGMLAEVETVSTRACRDGCAASDRCSACRPTVSNHGRDPEAVLWWAAAPWPSVWIRPWRWAAVLSEALVMPVFRLFTSLRVSQLLQDLARVWQSGTGSCPINNALSGKWTSSVCQVPHCHFWISLTVPISGLGYSRQKFLVFLF